MPDSITTINPIASGLGTSYNAVWSTWLNGTVDFSSIYTNPTRPYIQHGYFFAAVLSKANALASVDFRYFEGDWKSGRATISQNYDRYERLFDKPNSMMTGQEFWKIHSINIDVFGESLWVFLDRLKQYTTIDKAAELHHLNPMDWDLVVDEQTGKPMHWQKKSPSDTKIPVEFVYHFKEPNPYNAYRGIGRAVVAAVSIKTDIQAKDANANFIKNGFNLGGILTGEDWDAQQSDSVQKQIESKHSGPTKQGKMLVVGGNVKYYPNAMTHRGMQFIETLNFNREEILSIVGVPASWVSRGDQLNNSTSQSEDLGTWQRTMKPMMDQVKSLLWAVHFSNLGGKSARWLAFDYNSIPAIRASHTLQKTELAKKYAELGYPLNVINEQLELGMPNMPWGGEAYVNGAMRPITLVAEAGDIPTKQQFAESQEAAMKGPTAAPVEASGQNAAKGGTAREDESGADRRARAWREFNDDVLVPNQKKFDDSMNSYFNALRNETIKKLKKLPERGARDFTEEEIKSILFELSKWNAKILERTKPLYEAIAKDVTDSVKETLGDLSVWTEANPAIAKIIELRGAKLVGVNENIREALRESLVESSSKNLTIEETAKVIDALFDSGGSEGRGRSLTIARTETASAANAMQNEAFKAEGVERHEWASSRDAAVRDSHESLDGEVRKIGEAFSNGLKYPGDPSGPAEEVINCRCVAIPMLSNE